VVRCYRHFFAGSACVCCVVCAREKEGRLKGLCLLFYELGLYVGFLRGRALLIVREPASSVIPTKSTIFG